MEGQLSHRSALARDFGTPKPLGDDDLPADRRETGLVDPPAGSGTFALPPSESACSGLCHDRSVSPTVTIRSGNSTISVLPYLCLIVIGNAAPAPGAAVAAAAIASAVAATV